MLTIQEKKAHLRLFVRDRVECWRGQRRALLRIRSEITHFPRTTSQKPNIIKYFTHTHCLNNELTSLKIPNPSLSIALSSPTESQPNTCCSPATPTPNSPAANPSLRQNDLIVDPREKADGSGEQPLQHAYQAFPRIPVGRYRRGSCAAEWSCQRLT